jgi:hypothetical protein
MGFEENCKIAMSVTHRGSLTFQPNIRKHSSDCYSNRQNRLKVRVRRGEQFQIQGGMKVT